MPDNSAVDRFDLQRALLIARRRWWLVAACALAVAAAAAAFTMAQTKQYSTSAWLLLRDQGLAEAVLPTTGATQTVDPTREAQTNIDLVSSPAVADRTARAVHSAPAVVAGAVLVSAEGTTNLVSIKATDPDPARAAQLANTYAAQAISFRRQTDSAQAAQAQAEVQTQLNRLSPAQRRSSDGQLLQSRNQELKLLAATETGNIQLVQRAGVPSGPASELKRNLLLGLLVGLLLGLGAAALAERLSRRLRQPEELRDIYKLPVLTEVPEIRGLKHSSEPVALAPDERDAFRMLLARLRYTKLDSRVRSLLVTSADAREGKSTVAWYLAETAALGGNRRVLLVEADLRAPVLGTRHGLRAAPGLTDILAERAELEDVIQTIRLTQPEVGQEAGPQARSVRIKTVAANRRDADPAVQPRRHRVVSHHLPHGLDPEVVTMDVLVAGTPPRDPTTAMESQSLAQLLLTLGDNYDLVVFDTVPALLVADAMPLMTMVGGVLVVARVGACTREQATMLRDELGNMRVHTLGLIANGVKAGTGHRYGHYREPERGHRRRRMPHAAFVSAGDRSYLGATKD